MVAGEGREWWQGRGGSGGRGGAEVGSAEAPTSELR